MSGSEAEDRLAWFREARFGLFVHWGVHAVLGRGEQIFARDLMPLAEFEPLAEQFRPGRDWARDLCRRAVDAGAKYIVLTTRHHDGYCLFETDTTPFNAPGTGPGRDLVAEYTDAARDAGLRVGYYYSLLNWRWRGFWDPDRHPDDLSCMVDQTHDQVRELMTNYGTVDILWYDAAALPGGAAHGMWGGTPIDTTQAEFWRAEDLNAVARELQPDILINNRSGGSADFTTPEQRVSTEGQGKAWETCMTLNYAPGWGYLRHSLANKSAGEVLFNLVDAVRLGGNFLFNVGPTADGSVDSREADVLDQVGAWMLRHGEAIYGTAPEGVYDLSREHVQGPMFHYGMWTCRGKTGYLTLFYYPGDPVVVSKMGPKILSASLLSTGRPLEVEPASNGRYLIRGLPDDPPDALAPVVKVEFESPPFACLSPGPEWLDGDLAL